MRAACLQFAPRFGDVAGNRHRLLDLVRSAKAELVVLPELATTGYLFENREEALALAEPAADGETATAFGEVCREQGRYVCIGFAERDGERLYNSALLMGPDGPLTLYRKVHLFADEFEVFDPGDRGFPVARLDDGTVAGLMICFDWVFPEAARALALAGAELLLHPSNLVLPHCQETMRTRSLENGVFSLTANRTGTEERAGRGPLTFSGRSQIVSPRGEVLVRLGPTDEGLAVVDIDPAAAREKKITHTNHLLGDRRPEHYRILTEGVDQ